MRHLRLALVAGALLLAACSSGGGGGGSSSAARTWVGALADEGPFGAQAIDDVSHAHRLKTFVVFSDGRIAFSADWMGDVDAVLTPDRDTAATSAWQRWIIVIGPRDPRYPPGRDNLRLVITDEDQTFTYNLLPPGA